MATHHQHRKRRAPQGALHRSLAAMTVGVVKGQQAKEAADAPTALGEMVQHQQLEIAGKVGEKPMSRTADVYWPYPFVYAPTQRDSDFTNPHFNFGIEYEPFAMNAGGAVPSSHPLIMCGVTAWLSDQDGFSTGARILVTAWIPGAKKKKDFSAWAHLTFWGYGAPAEDDGGDTGADTGATTP